MSIKLALSRIRGKTEENGSVSPARSASPPLSARGILSKFLPDKSYIPSSDEDLSDESSTSGAISRNQQKRLARRARRSARSRLSEEIRTESQERRNDEEVAAARCKETAEMAARYGDLPLLQSRERRREQRFRFDDISSACLGQQITFTARVHTVRRMSSRLVFLIFRQQLTTFQGVLHAKPDEISICMVHWAERLRVGSIVRVSGTIQMPEMPVLGCTIHEMELLIDSVHVVVRREEPIPFSVYEAEIQTVEEEHGEGRRSHIPDHTRLMNRILDLRTATSQSIFRIQSGVSNLFRAALDERGFIEIHTPKLQGAATESGASVFGVNYFGRRAFLAQSPQLAKQMAIASDFGRVYEIGAVFRAENSNTHRHLTEYTGLDLEMAIEEHYHEMMETVDAAIKTILKGVYERYRREVETIKLQFPSEDVVWLDETPVLRFPDAIQLLNDSGWRNEDGSPLDPEEDLHTRDELHLGQLVKEKYGTDYYILDKFPTAVRPFYTMSDPDDPRFSNSFDIFVRGQEIVSGGQRIHDYHMLEQNMRRLDINPKDMEEYLEGFLWGAPPHAGAGIGLERILMLILNVGNIRLTSLFFRDPKSFPNRTPNCQIRHPEASTVDPPWQRDGRKLAEESELQDLADLVANYGDATATNWFDERFKIWRDYVTGAAVAYVPSTNNYAVIPGNPLCDPSQYGRIVSQFLQWIRRETKFHPIWILCFPDVENILAEKLGWRSVSCVADEVVDPSQTQVDSETARKIRHAESEGVKIVTVPQGKMVADEIREKIDQRIQDWLANRKGTQVHLSQITPWRDDRHRWYFYSTDKSGTICAFVALAMLSPRQGMQVKYSLDFPGSPSGSIEQIITHAIQTAAKSNVKTLTFGAGASATLTPGRNLHGAKIKMLAGTYATITKQFGLVRKSEFRAKLGAREQPLYIAYPPNGLGTRGIRAILNFFQD